MFRLRVIVLEIIIPGPIEHLQYLGERETEDFREFPPITICMTEHSDVLILGGGVIGLSTAWLLADAGPPSRLWTKASSAGKRRGPARHHRARSRRSRPHPLGSTSRLSGNLLPSLSRKLGEQTGINNGFLVCGGLELFLNEDESFSDERPEAGIPFEELEGDELHRRFRNWLRKYSGPIICRTWHSSQSRHPAAASGVCGSRRCSAFGLPRPPTGPSGSRIDAVDTHGPDDCRPLSRRRRRME